MKKLLLILSAIIFVTFSGTAQDAEKRLFELTKIAEKAQNDEIIPSITGAYVDSSGIKYFAKDDIITGTDVDEYTMYQLGSVGKALTAILVLQALEAGDVSLDTSVKNYLSNDNWIPDDITLKCLLTHSCGINDQNIGYLARTNLDVLPLGDYVRESWPGQFQPAGVDISYSNYSYALAGFVISEIYAESFENLIDTRIFEPLGMNMSSMTFPEGYDGIDNYAKAHREAADGFEEVQHYPRHAVPAGSLVSNAYDMGVFIEALLLKDDKLLKAEGWDYLMTPQYLNDPLLNGYSMGMEMQRIGDISFVAKGGQLQGMQAAIVVVPGDFALFYAINGNKDEMGEALIPRLLGVKETPLAAQDNAFDMSEYTGTWRNNRYNHETVENIVSLFQGAFTVWAAERGDGIVVWHNGSLQKYLPVSRDQFRHETLAHEYLVFKRDESGNVTNLYRNQNLGGLSVPGSYERVAAYDDPEFINEYYGFIPIFVIVAGFVSLLIMVYRLIAVRMLNKPIKQRLSGREHALIILLGVLLALHAALGPMMLFRNVQEFLFGIPKIFRVGQIVGYAYLAVTVGSFYLLVRKWRENGILVTKLLISALSISALLHALIMLRWDLL